MDAFLAGASVAAQSLGYCGLADIIVEEQLGAERIAFLFDLSASKTRDTDLAVILTAGSIASYNPAASRLVRRRRGGACS